jgi:hypothetical protein
MITHRDEQIQVSIFIIFIIFSEYLVPSQFPEIPYEIFPPSISVFLVPLYKVFAEIVKYKDFFKLSPLCKE